MPDRLPMRASATNAPFRFLAEQAFSRIAGAPLIAGNAVDLLVDARANFDAWLAAIRGAKSSILFENYIFGDDDVSRDLRAALTERAASGVCVCVVRDWLGSLGETSNRFWDSLREAGGEVRTYNPFRLSSPFGWLSRDHRKLLVVDSDVGFISGICASGKWLGNPARGIAPWRDTGVAVRGPAVRELAGAFADGWARIGERLPEDLPALTLVPSAVGTVDVRVVATLPSTTGLYRLDQMIAALAKRTLWLTDAYFVGTSTYVQALVAAANDGVDVRLLVPGTSDLPFVGAMSRAGYRVLLEAGIRVYEWNGSMLHAKTAVADGRWARVGSSNLNVASWMGNCEMDVAIEDEPFAQQMHAQYEQDLQSATEIVLDGPRMRRPLQGARKRRRGAGPTRAAAGALRLANSVGAALGEHRVLASSESVVLFVGSTALLGVAAVAIVWPRVVAWPLAAIAVWFSVGLAARCVNALQKARVVRDRKNAPR